MAWPRTGISLAPGTMRYMLFPWRLQTDVTSFACSGQTQLNLSYQAASQVYHDHCVLDEASSEEGKSVYVRPKIYNSCNLNNLGSHRSICTWTKTLSFSNFHINIYTVAPGRCGSNFWSVIFEHMFRNTSCGIVLRSCRRTHAINLCNVTHVINRYWQQAVTLTNVDQDDLCRHMASPGHSRLNNRWYDPTIFLHLFVSHLSTDLFEKVLSIFFIT